MTKKPAFLFADGRELDAAVEKRLREIQQFEMEQRKAQAEARKEAAKPLVVPNSIAEFRQLSATQIRWLTEHRKAEVESLFQREQRRVERQRLREQLENDDLADQMSADFNGRTGGKS